MPAHQPQRVKIDGKWQLHATLKDAPTFESEVSQHTNEKGANFIDHSREKLATLALDGVVSDLDGDVFPDGTYAQDFYEFMRDLQRNPRPVSIDTPREFYFSMLLKTFRPVRESRYGRALHFTAEFVEFRTVSLRKQTIEIKQQRQVKKGRQENQKPAPLVRTGARAGAEATGFVSEDTPYETAGGGIHDPKAGVSRVR
jgi:hypothetical protein